MMASINPPQNGGDPQETLLKFPCRFPVKAMGRPGDAFEVLVTNIILARAEICAGEQVTTSPSSSGKYISVMVVIEAQSKAQLDQIYQDLTDCEQVLVAL